MEINQQKMVKVNAAVLKIHVKVCDQFTARLYDNDGQELKDYEGYVPGFMPGQHYGDYLILDIDIDTGRILNWKQPEATQIEEFINGEND